MHFVAMSHVSRTMRITFCCKQRVAGTATAKRRPLITRCAVYSSEGTSVLVQCRARISRKFLSSSSRCMLLGVTAVMVVPLSPIRALTAASPLPLSSSIRSSSVSSRHANSSPTVSSPQSQTDRPYTFNESPKALQRIAARDIPAFQFRSSGRAGQ
jgi:hypothetical protein